MKSLLALGVTQLSDAYPNIKYKLELLARLKGFDCSEQLCILNNEGTDSASFSDCPPSDRSGACLMQWSLVPLNAVGFLNSRRGGLNSPLSY